MKKYFNYFIYISLIFLVYALYKANYLSIPIIYSYGSLIVAVVILTCGFIFDGVTWNKTLKALGYNTRIKDCIVSSGLSVFGKYIPGKLWIIIGRSAYIAQKYNFKESETSYVSFITQVISLWVGFTFGLIGLIFIDINPTISYLAIGAWIILSAFLTVKPVHRFISDKANKISKGKITIPAIKLNNVIKTTPYFAIRWIIFSFSFYLFASSISPDSINWVSGLGYPLAGTIGIIAIFTPGGLGVREGILTGYLIGCGFTTTLAATVGIASRLWYLAGEILIFLISITLKKTK